MTQRPPWMLLNTAVGVVLLAGCGGPAGPREVYERYLASLAAGDVEAAFALLAPASQSRLSQAEAAWREGTPDPLAPANEPVPGGRAAPGLHLFRRLVLGPAPGGAPSLPDHPEQRVGQAVVDGDSARVAVSALGTATQATLVRHGGSWRVLLDLP